MAIDDGWAGAEAYEAYMGRWSRLVAAEFVDWLCPGSGIDWLDVGCGTGALSRVILARADPARVVGVDPSASFVAMARALVDDPRATFLLGSATELPEPAGGGFRSVVSGLTLNFVPDAPAAIGAATAAAGPDGLVGAYVWDYAGRMELIRRFWDAAIELDPAAAVHDEGRRFPICAPEPLEHLFVGAGLVEVAVRAIDVPTRFADFEDYWRPFEAGTGPAPAYARSLSDAARAALRERLRAALPSSGDGTVGMSARAWAVRGRVPTPNRSHWGAQQRAGATRPRRRRGH